MVSTDRINKSGRNSTCFLCLIRYFLNEETGEVKKEGEIFTRPVFAQTLQEIATYGVDVFYNGSIGDKFAQDIQRRDGIITKEDLEQYRQVLN